MSEARDISRNKSHRKKLSRKKMSRKKSYRKKMSRKRGLRGGSGNGTEDTTAPYPPPVSSGIGRDLSIHPGGDNHVTVTYVKTKDGDYYYIEDFGLAKGSDESDETKKPTHISLRTELRKDDYVMYETLYSNRELIISWEEFSELFKDQLSIWEAHKAPSDESIIESRRNVLDRANPAYYLSASNPRRKQHQSLSDGDIRERARIRSQDDKNALRSTKAEILLFRTADSSGSTETRSQFLSDFYKKVSFPLRFNPLLEEEELILKEPMIITKGKEHRCVISRNIRGTPGTYIFIKLRAEKGEQGHKKWTIDGQVEQSMETFCNSGDLSGDLSSDLSVKVEMLGKNEDGTIRLELSNFIFDVKAEEIINLVQKCRALLIIWMNSLSGESEAERLFLSKSKRDLQAITEMLDMGLINRRETAILTQADKEAADAEEIAQMGRAITMLNMAGFMIEVVNTLHDPFSDAMGEWVPQDPENPNSAMIRRTTAQGGGAGAGEGAGAGAGAGAEAEAGAGAGAGAGAEAIVSPGVLEAYADSSVAEEGGAGEAGEAGEAGGEVVEEDKPNMGEWLYRLAERGANRATVLGGVVLSAGRAAKDIAFTSYTFTEEWVWYTCIEPVVKKIGIYPFMLACRQMFLRDGMDKYKSTGDGIDIAGLKRVLGSVDQINQSWNPIATGTALFFSARDEFKKLVQMRNEWGQNTKISYLGIAVAVALNKGRADAQAVELWNTLCSTMSGCELSGEYPVQRNMVKKIRIANALVDCINEPKLCASALSHLAMTRRLDYRGYYSLLNGLLVADRTPTTVASFLADMAGETGKRTDELRRKLKSVYSGESELGKILLRRYVLDDPSYLAQNAAQLAATEGGHNRLTISKGDVINVISESVEDNADTLLGWVGDRSKSMDEDERGDKPIGWFIKNDTVAASDHLGQTDPEPEVSGDGGEITLVDGGNTTEEEDDDDYDDDDVFVDAQQEQEPE